jgi:hypothetical protein
MPGIPAAKMKHDEHPTSSTFYFRLSWYCQARSKFRMNRPELASVEAAHHGLNSAGGQLPLADAGGGIVPDVSPIDRSIDEAQPGGHS